MSLSYAWRELAACRGNAELFFTERGQALREARRVCTVCPVRTECLDYAIAGGKELKGFWGGMSENQRSRLRRDAAV